MQLNDLQLVVKVAELGSISAAAASLDLSPATASAAVKRVEQELGTELFVRSTRRLRLSRAGENFLPRCAEALKTLEEARHRLEADQGRVEGEIRLAVSSDLGRNKVMPWLDELLEDHPGLSLRVNISDTNVDFYRDAVDMALRYGSPREAGLYGFKICDVPGVLCAAPDYLARHGTPAHPEDLKRHNGLFYQLHGVIHDQWTFSRGDERWKIRMHGNRAANDGDLVRRWCEAGLGLAVKSCLDMSEALLAGRVVPVMTDYRPRVTELWLICPSRHTLTPAMRLLRDHLRQKTQALLAELRARNLVS